MAYRRRWKRRIPRRRVIRRKRGYRRRRRANRKIPTRPGDFRCKLTKIQTFGVNYKEPTVWSCSVKPTDFDEWSNISANFEAYRFSKMRVRVYPLQSVSSTGNPVPMYCMFPWHQNIPPAKGYSAYLSIDKAKQFRGTQIGHQIYNMNIKLPNSTTAGNMNTALFNQRIEISSTAGKETHYSGCIGFQGFEAAGEKDMVYYNIVQDVYCMFYTQKSIPVPVNMDQASMAQPMSVPRGKRT